MNSSMKKILLTLTALAAVPAALAGGMYGCSGSGYYGGGWMFLKLIGFLVGAFLFSIIFWWTHVWIVQDKGQLKRKKK